LASRTVRKSSENVENPPLDGKISKSKLKVTYLKPVEGQEKRTKNARSFGQVARVSSQEAKTIRQKLGRKSSYIPQVTSGFLLFSILDFFWRNYHLHGCFRIHFPAEVT